MLVIPIAIVRSADKLSDVKYRDLLKQLNADGWEIVVTRGSHRQLKHPVKRGRVTVAGRTDVCR
ncbi:MAG TPA: type II toxin-antitoxin system HicA family toxin [Conexibacter sp.]|nr:type II toxin-antitoxin system HicA family toxin [Conexibacter sp.]